MVIIYIRVYLFSLTENCNHCEFVTLIYYLTFSSKHSRKPFMDNQSQSLNHQAAMATRQAAVSTIYIHTYIHLLHACIIYI